MVFSVKTKIFFKMKHTVFSNNALSVILVLRKLI